MDKLLLQSFRDIQLLIDRFISLEFFWRTICVGSLALDAFVIMDVYFGVIVEVMNIVGKS